MKRILPIIAFAGLISMTACDNKTQQQTALEMKQRTIDSMNNELAKKRVIDSMNEIARVQYVLPQNIVPAAPAAAPAQRVVYVNRAPKRTYASRQASYAPVAYQQPVQRKRGWSAKAKGAVIGTATGAAAGAIINGRNRVAGAVIGGLLGAGAGTGIGAIIDHRNGR